MILLTYAIWSPGRWGSGSVSSGRFLDAEFIGSSQSAARVVLEYGIVLGIEPRERRVCSFYALFCFFSGITLYETLITLQARTISVPTPTFRFLRMKSRLQQAGYIGTSKNVSEMRENGY